MKVYSIEERRHAALLVYIKWAWVERTGNHNDLFDERYGYKIRIEFENYYEAGCPWCDMYHTYSGWEHTCDGCPLLEYEGVTCFSKKCLFEKATFSAYSIAERKVSAGEIARIAWAEYKRLGG